MSARVDRDEFNLGQASGPAPLFDGGRVASEPPMSSDPEIALRQLHDEFAQRIYSYSLSILRSREDAEDAVQTTFMNAFGSLQAGRIPRQRSSWMFRIAKNVCLNRIRTQQRKPVQTLEGIDVAAVRGFDEAFEQRLHARALRIAIERLPEQQRTAIVMRELQGASYNEIAQALHTTQGAVESLIFRARKQLAATLQSAEGFGLQGGFAQAA